MSGRRPVIVVWYLWRRRRHGGRRQRRGRRRGEVYPGVQHPCPTSLVEILVAGMKQRRAGATAVRLLLRVVVEAEETREEGASALVEVQLRLEMTDPPINDKG